MAGSDDFFRSHFGKKEWHVEPFDEKDHLYEPAKDMKAAEYVNLREDSKYRNFWQGVYDQGFLSSCVANAAAALYSYELQKELAATKSTIPPAIDPSRMFIWYTARVTEEIKKDKFQNAGCHIRSAMKSLQQKGVCKEVLCPYPPGVKKQEDLIMSSQHPLDEAYAAAQAYCTWQYERLDPKRSDKAKKKLAEEVAEKVDDIKNKDGDMVKDNLCKAITEGHAVQFGIHYYYQEQSQQFKQIDTMKGKKWSLTPLSKRHVKHEPGCGSHSVLAFGYDEYSVMCQTSSGVQDAFSDEGFFLVPWGWISDFEATEDFWIIRGFQGLLASQR